MSQGFTSGLCLIQGGENIKRLRKKVKCLSNNHHARFMCPYSLSHTPRTLCLARASVPCDAVKIEPLSACHNFLS